MFLHMMPILTQPCHIADLTQAPNFQVLLALYAQESALDELPTPHADLKAYQMLEDQGTLQIVGAWLDDELVGFIGVNLTYAPQYSINLGMTLFFFVLPKYRKHGTGKKLIDSVCKELHKFGAKALLIGAPAESRLAKAAGLLGFRESNRLYLKRLQ